MLMSLLVSLSVLPLAALAQQNGLPAVTSAPAAGAHISPTAQPSPVSVVVDRPDTTP